MDEGRIRAGHPVRSRLPRRRGWQGGANAAITGVLAAAAATLLAVLRPAHAADEFDTLRGKWHTLLTGVGASDPADPDVARRISGITTEAQRWWSAMDATPGTYLWSDLASTTASDQITAAYHRIRSMALGYATLGSPVHRDAALLADLHTALDWMHANRYNAGKSEYANWWDWEIGAPLALTDTMVMLYDQLTATQLADNLETIGHFQHSVTMTGANRVWQSTIITLCGILGKDASLVATGRDGLSAVLPYVVAGDGFYVDGSFIQHDKYSYLGGYGVALLENLARLVFVLQGSTWAVTSPQLGNVWRWVHDSIEPLIYKGAVLDMTRGRQVSRPIESEHGSGHLIIRSVLLLAQAAPPADAAAYQAMVKYWIQADTHLNFVTSAPIYHLVQAKAVLDDPGIAARPVLTANRQFAAMGQVVHRRPGYAYAISMSSNRTANYESINNEHLKGWYTGDGETFLYNDDLGQFSDNYQPTIDPYRRPGTTTDTGQVRADSSGYGYLSPSDWAGGTVLSGTYGAAGMDLDAYGNSLVAKKSWFMFDDEIVALGAGISSTDNRTIETTVENRKLTAAGDNAFVVDGVSQPTAVGWSSTALVGSAHLAGNVPGSDIGYYFPGGQTVQMRRQSRTGTWTSINKLFPDSTPRSANYLTISVSHGTNPSGATYAYVLLPGRSAAQTAAYAQRPGVVVLANTATVQAVRQTRLGIVGANFWTDAPVWVQVGGTNFAFSDRRASLLVRESATGLDVSVADPTQSNTGTIFIEISRPASGILAHDPRIVVAQLSPTIRFAADVAGARGKPLEVSFGSATGPDGPR
jgi:hyaluronate lyase